MADSSAPSPKASMAIPLVVACAMFMTNIDGTVVTTALPDMAISLETTPAHLSVAITAYLLSLAVFIPASGWIADRFGSRTVFGGAIALFTVTSVWCGFSHGVIELTVARVFQGIGGAMMVPVGRLVVMRSLPKSEFVRANSYITVPAFVGPIVGPPLGGFITTYLDWRWVFFITVPIGILGIALVAWLIKNHKGPERKPLDHWGFVFTGGSLGCLMYLLEAVGRQGEDRGVIAVFTALTLGLGVLAVRHAWRHPAPMLDLKLLKIPTLRVTVDGGCLYRISAGSLGFLLPIFLQVGLGMTAFQSGLITLAGAIGSVTAKSTIQLILRRWGFRNLLIRNGLLCVAGALVCCFFTEAPPPILMFLALLIGGLFRSVQFTTLTTLAYADVPNSRMAGATSLNTMTQQLTYGFGIAIGAVMLQMALILRGAPPEALDATDIRYALLGVAGFALVSIPFFLVLKPDAGAELSQHRIAGKAPSAGLAEGEVAEGTRGPS